jgi:hypothetical protein
VRLGPLGTSATNWLQIHDECGAAGGTDIDSGNRNA